MKGDLQKIKSLYKFIYFFYSKIYYTVFLTEIQFILNLFQFDEFLKTILKHVVIKLLIKFELFNK